MVYLFEEMAELDASDLNLMLPLLSEQRREAVDRYCRIQDKTQRAVAYLLLLLGLHEEYHMMPSPSLEWDFGSYGKPYLKSYDRIHFSLSHVRTGVACALASSEVGIDIEQERTIDLRMVTPFCSSCERALLELATPTQRLLISLWTMKESYGKYCGVGLHTGHLSQKTLLCSRDGKTDNAVTLWHRGRHMVARYGAKPNKHPFEHCLRLVGAKELMTFCQTGRQI
jgi:4'-phosphopantetheinyl transferase